MQTAKLAVPVAVVLSSLLVFAVAAFLIPAAMHSSGLALQVGIVVVPLAVLCTGLYLVVTGLYESSRADSPDAVK